MITEEQAAQAKDIVAGWDEETQKSFKEQYAGIKDDSAREVIINKVISQYGNNNDSENKVISGEQPKQTVGEQLDKAISYFTNIAKSVPLSDKIKQAGMIGRGVDAIENGIKIQDAPSIVAKIASARLGNVPEFMAKNPIAGAIEKGAKLAEGHMNATRQDFNIFPKSYTKEGENLGNQMGIATAFATAFMPIGEKSIADRITAEAAKEAKIAKLNLENATSRIVEFDSKVRNSFFAAKAEAGAQWEQSVSELNKTQPDKVVNLKPAFDNLGIEIDEANKLTSASPKLASDIKSALGKASNKTLQDILIDPSKAENLTLEESQQIVQSIKKIPSFAAKLKQGKFANWSESDGHLIDFIHNIRDQQLSAFPEFQKTLDAYRETMHKYNLIKPYFKETNLVNNIVSNFKGNPVIQKFVGDILPEGLLKEMTGVRNTVGTIQKAKSVASKVITGALLGEGFNVGRHFLH